MSENSAPGAHSEAAALQVGDLIELEITGIAHGGICVARHDGRVVFVADTIPGERVRARVTEARKKSFARAATVEVLDASQDRRPHIWAEAALEREPERRAGGAEFGHIALERQRELKAEVLVDALRRFGKLSDRDIASAAGAEIAPAAGADAALGSGADMAPGASVSADSDANTNTKNLGVLVEAAPGDDEANGLGWRTRVRLHVDPEVGTVGPYAARSQNVIRVASLPLANEEIGVMAPLDEQILDVEAVDLIAPSADDPRMLISEPGKKTRAGARDVITEVVRAEGPGGYEEPYELEFAVPAGGFWQVHREAPAVLFGAVRGATLDLIKSGRFDPAATNLDLYGGVGLLAAAMADAVGPGLKVTTVESDTTATDAAAENLAGLVGALALTGRVDRYLAELLRAAPPVRDRVRRATVVLDPPRSGAGGQVCAQLGELAPANLVYVACDPVALARDTATLREQGYTLTSLRAFDLFPHTHHVEALAVFTR